MTWEFDHESAIQMGDFKYGYLYDPNVKEYVLAWKDGDWTEEIANVFSSTGDLYHTSMWVFSERQETLTILWSDNEKDSYSINNKQVPWNLINGWNFIYITPEMIGDKISDIKGSCNIEKVYWWNENKEWDVLEVEEQLHSGFVGEGFVLKVSEDCILGTDGSLISPPEIPGYGDELRSQIGEYYYEEFSYEECELNNAAEYISKRDCELAWDCLADEYVVLIPEEDLQELADYMEEHGGESGSIWYNDQNPSVNEQLTTKFDTCLSGRHNDY
jgi:hypothetical protein